MSMRFSFHVMAVGTIKGIIQPMKKILVLLSVFIVTPLFAKDRDHDTAYRLKQSGEILPLEIILEHAKRYHDGQIIEVELEEKRKQFIYEIEIIDTNGILWEMKLDATDGTLLSEEQEHGH